MSDVSGERFLETLGRVLLSLPFDLKILVEAMSEPDLDRHAKELAAGGVLYVLARNDSAPPDHPHLAYVDDAIMVRLALREIRARGGDGAEAFCGRFPDVFDNLEGDLATLAGYLGDGFLWVASRVDALSRQVHRGKKLAQYLDDPEAGSYLYDEFLEFQTEYEVDEEVVSRMRRADLVRSHLDQRMQYSRHT